MLKEIREDSQKFTNVIANTLDVDVLIIDGSYDVIASSVRYLGKYEGNKPDSLAGDVVRNRRTVVVEDKAELLHCRECGAAGSCVVAGFIGVPIVVEGEVAGAIAIYMTRERTKDIFRDRAGAVEFVSSMAELLSSKLLANRKIKELKLIQHERETIADTLPDAFVVVDTSGVITYFNRSFTEFFCPGESAAGRKLIDITSHDRIRELLASPMDMRGYLIFIRAANETFYGFLSCTTVYTDKKLTGICFRFRQLLDARPHVLSSRENMHQGVSFAWLGGGFFTEHTTAEAKKLAVTDKNILIQGEDGTGKRMLARCIHNYSDRSERSAVVVECFRMYREHVPKSIFGILGKLQTANRGTLIFSHIERLPLALQAELVDFLKHPALRHQGGPELMIDVRFIFLTAADLRALAAKGMFSEELYYRISEHVIAVPPMREQPELLRLQIDNAFDYYKKAYDKPDLTVEDGAVEALCRYSWPGNLQELEACCDCLVYGCAEAVTLGDVYSGPADAMHGAPEDSERTISQIERQMIAEFLSQGQSKEKIAHTLGISRATLYRKIKNYDL